MFENCWLKPLDLWFGNYQCGIWAYVSVIRVICGKYRGWSQPAFNFTATWLVKVYSICSGQHVDVTRSFWINTYQAITSVYCKSVIWQEYRCYGVLDPRIMLFMQLCSCYGVATTGDLAWWLMGSNTVLVGVWVSSHFPATTSRDMTQDRSRNQYAQNIRNYRSIDATGENSFISNFKQSFGE